MLQNNFIKVGIWYVMWDNIGKVKENRECMELLPQDRQINQKCSTKSSTDEPTLASLDCHSSTKGLFTGNMNVIFLLIRQRSTLRKILQSSVFTQVSFYLRFQQPAS